MSRKANQVATSEQQADSIRVRIQETHPLLIAAAAEVDRTLLDWSLALSPMERLQACTRATRALSSFDRVAPASR